MIETIDGPFPQSYCHTCEKGLSPCGSQKAAEEAQAAHRDSTRTSPNVPGEHTDVVVYSSAEALRAALAGD